MTNRSAERTQFYQDILDTGMEFGYSWFQYKNIKRDPVTLSYISAEVNEMQEVGDYEEMRAVPRGTVTIETIAKAFGILRAAPVKYMHPDTRTRFLHMYENPDLADFDVNDADTLLQLGILGEIVYG